MNMPSGSEVTLEKEAFRRRVGRSEAARIVGLAFWIDSMVLWFMDGSFRCTGVLGKSV